MKLQGSSNRPKFILLDEPFAGVDPIAVEDIQHIISALKTKKHRHYITDHNVYETLAITDRAYLLYEGSILYSGTLEELAKQSLMRAAKYLGTNFDLRKAVLHDKKMRKISFPTLETRVVTDSTPKKRLQRTTDAEADNGQNKKYNTDDYYDSKFSKKQKSLKRVINTQTFKPGGFIRPVFFVLFTY